jgi:hypothetical protein
MLMRLSIQLQHLSRGSQVPLVLQKLTPLMVFLHW